MQDENAASNGSVGYFFVQISQQVRDEIMTDQYFRRVSILLGQEKLDKLKNTSIAVIGLGGVGSHALEAIARCGVGEITLMDPDRVEESNINRQLPAMSSTIGEYKTDVMEKRLYDINPHLLIHKLTSAYTPDNSSFIIDNDYDYVIDAIDSFQDKIHLIKTCLDNHVPIISSMGTANRVNPLLLTIADIKDTRICPLARRVRRELRHQGISSGLDVVYSSELPLNSGPQLGSIIYVTAAAGLILASHVINRVLDLSQ